MYSGDFDIEDRVTAREGEQVIPLAAFGNYDESIYGEIETHDRWTVGDFNDESIGDDADFGRFKMKRPKFKAPTKISPKALANAVKSPMKALPKPPVSAPSALKRIAGPKAFPSPAAAIRSVPRMGGRKLGWPKKLGAPKITMPKIASPITSGTIHAPVIPKASALPDLVHRQVANLPVKVQNQVAQAVAKMPAQASDAAKAAVAAAVAKQIAPKEVAKAKSDEVKGTASGTVLVNAGQPITAAPSSTPSPATVQAVAKARSQYSHPLLAVMNPMGDDEMGFDLKSFISKATTDAKTALNKAISDGQAALKQQAGTLLSKQATNFLSDPKVQTFTAEKAKQSAAQAIAEKLVDPTFQRQAAMTTGKVALGVGAAVAIYMFLKSRKKLA